MGSRLSRSARPCHDGQVQPGHDERRPGSRPEANMKLNELRDKHKNLVESLRVSLGLDELDTLTEDDD